MLQKWVRVLTPYKNGVYTNFIFNHSYNFYFKFEIFDQKFIDFLVKNLVFQIRVLCSPLNVLIENLPKYNEVLQKSYFLKNRVMG